MGVSCSPSCIGYVEYRNDNELKQLLGDRYYNADAIWDEAKDRFDETDSSEVEVRIDGLKYIIITMV